MMVQVFEDPISGGRSLRSGPRFFSMTLLSDSRLFWDPRRGGIVVGEHRVNDLTVHGQEYGLADPFSARHVQYAANGKQCQRTNPNSDSDDGRIVRFFVAIAVRLNLRCVRCCRRQRCWWQRVVACLIVRGAAKVVTTSGGAKIIIGTRRIPVVAKTGPDRSLVQFPSI